MKLSAFIVSLALIAIVSGCASNQHVYSSDGKCLTCWNNPVTGNPINHDGSANQKKATQESQVAKTTTTDTTVVNTSANKPTEHKIVFTVPVNVDLAFLKIKKEFNYQTEQEIRQEWGSLADTKMQTFAYAYGATPSLYYHMRAHRNHDGVMAVIDSLIEKQSDKESAITITYWLTDKSVNATQFGESLKKRTRRALNI
ncbi:hypothetical protein ACJJI4_23720 (plasmid) [Microbulbifer sp. TRSA002]|uniref:hypothetical protein n=1 Tax=Microbulbifer sp. TRSA002 TaxID=3243382 RepID=UPI00403A1D21